MGDIGDPDARTRDAFLEPGRGFGNATGATIAGTPHPVSRTDATRPFVQLPPVRDMTLMGSRLQAIGLQDGIGAMILALLGTLLVGVALVAMGYPGDHARLAFPPLAAAALANVAGIRLSQNPRAVLFLGLMAMLLQAAIASAIALG